jgi:hypothetical protein
MTGIATRYGSTTRIIVEALCQIASALNWGVCFEGLFKVKRSARQRSADSSNCPHSGTYSSM